MSLGQSDLAPRLIGLFYVAGLLESDEWDTYVARHEKHKPILDVLMSEEVSLKTFGDLLQANITFKSSRGNKKKDVRELHAGLMVKGLINDGELEEMLDVHRPSVERLLEAMRRDGVISGEAVQRLTDIARAGDEENPAAMVGQLTFNAATVTQWLNRTESRAMRQAACHIGVSILQANKLLGEEAPAAVRESIEAGDFAQLRQLLANRYKLHSPGILEHIEAGLHLPQARLDAMQIDSDLFRLFPQSLVRRELMVPFSEDDQFIYMALSDPFNVSLVALISWIAGRTPQAYFAPGRLIIDKINSYYHTVRAEGGGNAQAAGEGGGDGGPRQGPPFELEREQATSGETAPRPRPRPTQAPSQARLGADIVADNVSAVQLVSSMIESAIELRTTDIHIEPMRNGLVVRFRIDGELHRIMNVPRDLAQPVVSRVKVLADMDVTERRRPQDGHFELPVGEHGFDFRISTIPAVHGEKLVIRILDTARVDTGLGELGLLEDQQKSLEWMIDRPHGMILVTGPTGSGKTSTLYAALNQLNSENRNLVTIEDPVEYQLPGITQVQVDTHIDLTFAQGLRSILRQDPDVIMVGEVRDADTAQIAIRAAMTGHLVLSTLHTNTALSAITALQHLGAMPFMVAGSLVGILSQRLVRRLCTVCRKPVDSDEALLRQLGMEQAPENGSVYAAQGCDECIGSGYAGRTGVFEVIRINEDLRMMIPDADRTVHDLEKYIRERGVMSMREAAVIKVLEGVTSVEEVSHKIILELD